jgi:hypothetical protein
MGQRTLFMLVACVLCLIVAGIGSSARTIDRAANGKSSPAMTVTPTKVNVADASPRVALGDTQASIEQSIGPPTGLSGTMLAYAGGKLAVAYQQGHATGVLVSFGNDHPTLDNARGKVQAMLPTDRILVGTMAAGANRIADVYQSAHLKAHATLATPTATPGQFVVVYEDDGTGAVRDALVLLGDVPTG